MTMKRILNMFNRHKSNKEKRIKKKLKHALTQEHNTTFFLMRHEAKQKRIKLAKELAQQKEEKRIKLAKELAQQKEEKRIKKVVEASRKQKKAEREREEDYVSKSQRIRHEREHAEYMQEQADKKMRYDSMNTWEGMMGEFDRVIKEKKKNGEQTEWNRNHSNYNQNAKNGNAQSHKQKRTKVNISANLIPSYNILNSASTDTFKVIRQRYLALCKMYHPDTYINDDIDNHEEKEQMMQKINNAYDVICEYLGKK